jgi:nitrogen fixation protein FixH
MIREVKGWHVLMVLLAFFGVTIAVNAYFVTMALQTGRSMRTTSTFPPAAAV